MKEFVGFRRCLYEGSTGRRDGLQGGAVSHITPSFDGVGSQAWLVRSRRSCLDRPSV
jgi:hypothetical protein